jgi:uncharacterized phage protein (TIGR01671 family)
MREIKFRAKTKDGDWFKWKITSPIDAKEFLPALDKQTLGQYTGLKDKNGREIFSGDIIDIHQTINGYNLFRIDFDEKIMSVKVFYLNGKEYEYNIRELLEVDEYDKEIEIIGNIYENLELLN